MEALGNSLLTVAILGGFVYSVYSLCTYMAGAVKDTIRTIIREELNHGR